MNDMTKTKPEQTQLQPSPGVPVVDKPMGVGFDAIIKAETGGVSNEIRASYDITTPDGSARLVAHRQFNGGEGEKALMYNVPFMLAAYVSWPIAIKKDKDGSRLEQPRLSIRTVLETSEGEMFSSSSVWLYQSLLEIMNPSDGSKPELPIKVRLGKAGPSDKLFRVIDDAAKPGKGDKGKGGSNVK